MSGFPGPVRAKQCGKLPPGDFKIYALYSLNSFKRFPDIADFNNLFAHFLIIICLMKNKIFCH
jgi:hypothetical protein